MRGAAFGLSLAGMNADDSYPFWIQVVALAVILAPTFVLLTLRRRIGPLNTSCGLVIWGALVACGEHGSWAMRLAIHERAPSVRDLHEVGPEHGDPRQWYEDQDPLDKAIPTSQEFGTENDQQSERQRPTQQRVASEVAPATVRPKRSGEHERCDRQDEEYGDAKNVMHAVMPGHVA
jgi:hypothetical protein